MINISATGVIAYTNDGICYRFASFVGHLSLDSDMCLQKNITISYGTMANVWANNWNAMITQEAVQKSMKSKTDRLHQLVVRVINNVLHRESKKKGDTVL